MLLIYGLFTFTKNYLKLFDHGLKLEYFNGEKKKFSIRGNKFLFELVELKNSHANRKIIIL